MPSGIKTSLTEGPVSVKFLRLRRVVIVKTINKLPWAEGQKESVRR